MRGLLLVDKPIGITSFDVVSRVRSLAGQSQVGHTGSLDKYATGVLGIMLGKCTKLMQYLEGHAGAYRFGVRFGMRTDTLDINGELEETADHAHLDEQAVREAAETLTGTIEQIPPAYSAIKVDGDRASDRARAGEDVELDPREVEIEALDLVDFDGATAVFDVVCESGTYVRSLARDLGEMLDTCGFASSIRRLRKGPFELGEAAPLGELTTENLQQRALPPVEAVATLPRVPVSEEEARLAAHGTQLRVDDDRRARLRDEEVAAVVGPDEVLVGIAEVRPLDAEIELQPRTVLADPERFTA